MQKVGESFERSTQYIHQATSRSRNPGYCCSGSRPNSSISEGTEEPSSEVRFDFSRRNESEGTGNSLFHSALSVHVAGDMASCMDAPLLPEDPSLVSSGSRLSQWMSVRQHRQSFDVRTQVDLRINGRIWFSVVVLIDDFFAGRWKRCGVQLRFSNSLLQRTDTCQVPCNLLLGPRDGKCRRGSRSPLWETHP